MPVALRARTDSLFRMPSRRQTVPRRRPAAAPYAQILSQLKARVRTAQLKAALSANSELILLYWDVGRTIVETQANRAYGRQVVEKLARDLKREFPAVRGLSALNLWRMRAFYLAYSQSSPILSQAVTESQIISNDRLIPPNARQDVSNLGEKILSQLVTESSPPTVGLKKPPAELLVLPWGHNLLLLHKIKNVEHRLWYARAAAKFGWSRAMTLAQIEAALHERQGHAVNNFKATLPAVQSDLAEQTLKDPYIFDFLTLDTAARERELETGLLKHIEQFLVELGVGFAFVGRQYRLNVGDDEFAIDLLFYHLRLRCFVVVDLKMEAFKPEFVGKMNFYLSAVDVQLRHASDQPSIGLLLCKENNRLVVEYALRDLRKPVGVAEWRARLVDSLPKKLQSELPSVAEIEAEFSQEVPRATRAAKRTSRKRPGHVKR
jgi:predicted nuclease of restriction endonuclease-like (RecB) superfamily